MKALRMRADSVPDGLWTLLSEFIAERTGLHFPRERRLDLERGLAAAAAEFGFPDTAACAAWLLSSRPLTRPQLHTLASHLTVGETYFFRERKAFAALAEHILPELIRRRRGHEQRLRLWSAACSTGEEPYSLAILLHELLPDWDRWHVTILATDINTRSLQKAAAGVYGEWSFRDAPSDLREQYFARTADERFAVAARIRKRVTFAQLNLAQDGFPSLATDTNAMDVILCRNVLMYFTAPQARRLVENLGNSLLDDGWLCVSPSECSQSLFHRFAAVTFPGAILYRKPDTPEPSAPAQPPAPTLAANEPATLAFEAYRSSMQEAPGPTLAEHPGAEPDTRWAASSEPADPIAAAQALYTQGRYAEAAEILLPALAPTARAQCPPLAFSLLTRALANQGKLDDALAWSERWVAADKLNASPYYVRAMILQELGDMKSARHCLQRAVYLQADFALAHFALGNCARREAPGGGEKKHLDNALRLLRGRPPDELVPESEGLTAGRLTEIICAVASQTEFFK
ncbi:MAG TPA: CheR family methyltransferase [Steroidobacteraceae bacterium]|nr:CheR family methyltransferase [Steroidobacteraceae bacterium]